MNDSRRWGGEFGRGVFLWLVPVILVWAAVTPLYNRLLASCAESLLRFTERPAMTQLYVRDGRFLAIGRADFGGRLKDYPGSLTDVHFDLLLLGALILGTPRIAWRRRARALGLAVSVMILFHVVLTVFCVKFTLATQLGEWSLQHFGPWARNFWGLGKHLLDLPVKFALPFALWAGFFLREIPRRTGAQEA